ncbi:bifunctional DNA primase/polymerase [Candidatus Acetothermia bacterium]|nr:bifunctional DNA primase/polymerase [Candidatus Acetothermia bacterium]
MPDTQYDSITKFESYQKKGTLDAALDYLHRGWSIIPIKPRDKRPLVDWAEFQSRRPTEDEVRSWFERWPEANVAIVTGAISNIIVLDIEADAHLNSDSIKKDHPVPITTMSRSGSGGQHIYFHRPRFHVPNAVRILPGVDLRGDGGYVVAPPSLHPCGQRYEWIIELIKRQTKLKKDWSKLSQGVLEGQRNETAASMVGKLLSRLKPQDWDSVAWPLLQAWNAKNRPPLDERELRTIFDSIAKRESSKRSTTTLLHEPKPLAFPESSYVGVAAEFADLFAEHTEAPKEFYYMSFLTYLGAAIAPDVTLDSSIHPQPRLYTVLLGKSADTRKSTALRLTDNFFQEALVYVPVLHGAGSAEGLAEAFIHQENNQKILVLHYDELKSFVDKARIEGSVLLPTVTTLFERNHYQNAVKGRTLEIQNAFLSLVAACTPETYASMFDSRFFAIGFLNRLFLVLGEGHRRFHLPPSIPTEHKNQVNKKLQTLLQDLRACAYSAGSVLKLHLSPQADEALHTWYLSREESDFSKRIDTYAHRFLIIFAVLKREFQEISLETVKQVTALCDYELEVRRECEPVEASSKVAELEEKIRRTLQRGPMKKRDLQRKVHAD